MTPNPLLNWAVLAVSIFNALLLAWLGLTVLLNSDRRRWGIWVAGGGMLLGSAFFISHSAILGLGLIDLGWETLIFWWSIGLLSAISLPFLWVVIMLWYAGYWEDRQSRLHHRQRPWLILTAVLLLLGILGIITAAISLGIDSPHFGQWFLFLRFSGSGIPILVLGFSSYMLMSIALALDALRRPGPSARVMGQLARRRARPWLVAATIDLLLIALIVTSTLFWVGRQARQLLLSQVYNQTWPSLTGLDLLVSFLIAIAIILLGQAIVSYEVFTGKSLPRGGLRRQWQRALILAAGAGALVAAALALDIEPIYGFLGAALLMILFFALVGWRSYLERERLMANLRPFVASQGLYDRLLTPGSTAENDFSAPFNALCRDLLDTQSATLIAAGLVATLVERPLIYPPAASNSPLATPNPPLATPNPPPATPNSPPATRYSSLIPLFSPQKSEPLAIDPDHYGSAIWAIPLWSARGLSGVLLLGEKRGGGLYTQEEIEIAAITGERLIDTQAGAEMSRRLLELQRRQLTQTQVFDQQTRRVLHDEILPDLHAALISLGGSDQNEELLTLLSGTHRQISDLLHELPAATAPEVQRLGLLEALRRTVEGEYAAAFDAVQWQVQEGIVDRVQNVPDLAAGVIFYAAREAVRNAARHGRKQDSEEPFILTINAVQPSKQDEILFYRGEEEQQELQIVVTDNGRGLTEPAAPAPGSGQGLALHSTMMAIIGGVLSISSVPGEQTRVILAFGAH